MRLVWLWATLAHRVLYPRSACKSLYSVYIVKKLITVLYLNRFRRKPAISKFDWLFHFVSLLIPQEYSLGDIHVLLLTLAGLGVAGTNARDSLAFQLRSDYTFNSHLYFSKRSSSQISAILSLDLVALFSVSITASLHRR